MITLAVFFSFALPRHAAAQTYSIDDAVIEGNRRVETAAIRQQLKKTKGEVSGADISEDVKSLYRTGFFDQVTAALVKTQGAAAQNLLRYTVVEKPVVRKVFIKGNEHIDESELAEMLTFEGRRFLDKSKIDAVLRKALSLYQSRGFHDAVIDYSVVAIGENQVDVTFIVKENERYKIRSVQIKGLTTLDESDVLAAMQTKRYKWWNSWLFGTGRLNSEMLENDRSLMRQYFLDHGLIDATISEPQAEKREDGFYVTFEVVEGQLYKIGSVHASGDLLEGSLLKTLDGIKSRPGETFSASRVREDSFAISDKFSDIGYAFANVVPNTSVDSAEGVVNLNFEVEKGAQVTVNRINIKGNEKTLDHVIRRELKIDEQETYSGKKVKRSQELLQRLGYFEEVNISSSPVGKDKVDLDVNVREGSTGSFSAGAGYSTADGVIFNTRVAETNIFGSGRRAVVNVDIGTERSSYVFSLDDRRINDSYWAGGLELQRSEREYQDFDRELTGGALTAGYPLEQVFGETFEDTSFSLKYEILNIDISHVNDNDAAQLVIDSEGNSTASGMTPKITRNTINNPLNPTKGSRQEMSVELTGLGGNQEFYLAEARNTVYYPLFPLGSTDLVLSWRTAFGYGDSYNGEPLPLYRRYFPGGINSVRGYKERTLGPKDINGNEYGGSKQLVNNFDLIFPIFPSAGFKGVIFYDAGQAFDDNQSIDIGELRQGYGLGIRWQSPLGPMRIEVGFPIARESGERRTVTMFSFGAPL